ncbi:MAG: 3-dehydroquinate synthase [Patescibacteria group bacterium]|nr:3-dehydroquinate synthase [Patescibacteria group bacterium]
MIKVPVTIPGRVESYQIVIGDGLLQHLTDVLRLEQYSKIAVVTDETVAAEVLAQHPMLFPADALRIVVPAGEDSKAIERVTFIWERLLAHGFDRKSCVVNVGGGMIGDLGGFAASTYMRGIDAINIPTTVLAQVDASIGGKTGINFGGIKNLIGTFAQPKMVIADIGTLKTLPDREFLSGFAEIIKHGLIHNDEYFRFVTLKKPREFTPQELMHIVEESCKIKADIVISDIHEQTGRRKLLNFGHTIGHAIEAYLLTAQTPILHGEAVAIGMIAEAHLSELAGYLSAVDVQTIRSAIANAGLPTRIGHVSADTLITNLSHDKKSEFGMVKWTLIRKIGEGVADCEVDEANLRRALAAILT